MRITSRGEYGVRALFDLAVHYNQGPVPLKQIAERQGISDHYLEQLMAALRKAGLVRSVRGASGGYELAHEPRAITVGAVLRALEGPILTPSETEGAIRDEIHRQVLDALWERVDRRVNEVLDEYTLQDLLEMLEELRAQSGVIMWHI